MKEQEISKVYANSIIQLGKDAKIDLAEELTKLNQLIADNNDLETVLFLDVFTIEEKTNVLTDVMNKLEISELLKHIVIYILLEKRIGLFPMIFKEVVVIDDHEKGFFRGTIEGADEKISSEVKEKLQKYIESKLKKKADLTYKKSEKISAGYRVTVEDLQIDASLENQLNNFKKSILN